MIGLKTRPLALFGGMMTAALVATYAFIALLLGTGAILFSLGVIAEYVGVAVNMAMGKPLYLIVGDPKDGPLGRPKENGPNGR